MFIGGRCIIGGRFWGGKGLESKKGVLEEKELLGVNIIGVFLPVELLGDLQQEGSLGKEGLLKTPD